ncbi:MAG: hypothetical protein ACI8ZW_001903, partial [Yoonia sp.]
DRNTEIEITVWLAQKQPDTDPAEWAPKTFRKKDKNGDRKICHYEVFNQEPPPNVAP